MGPESPDRSERRALESEAGERGAPGQSRLADLYLRHAGGALRLAYLLTGDRMLAEDLTHDAFIRAAGRLAHMRDPGAFGAYLRRAVVNQARMHFRRRGVERAYLRRESLARQVAPSPSVHDIETRDVLRHALLSLPLRQRTALVLRFYEDLSDTQAAEIMRCRPGTVRSLVSRGLSTLRTTTEEGDEDG